MGRTWFTVGMAGAAIGCSYEYAFESERTPEAPPAALDTGQPALTDASTSSSAPLDAATTSPTEVDPTESEDSAPPEPEDTGTVAPGGCADDLVPATFEFPADALSCAGRQWVREVPSQGLWVGVVECDDGYTRFYLASNSNGPYLPALDAAGHGQDHCELVNPAFTLPNEDAIDSGSCPSCRIQTNLPLEGVSAYGRAFLGTSFFYVPTTPSWSYQTSRIDCGCAWP
jgi:hypothetical protein